MERTMVKRERTRIFIVAILIIGVGAGCTASQGAVPTDASVTVAEVIDRYVQASGGPALAEVKTETRRGTLVRGQSGKVPFEASSAAPGKWFYNQTFAYGDQVSFVCDGTDAWVQDTKGVSRMTGAERLDLEIVLDVALPLRIRELFPEMVIKGIEKRDGRDVVVIRARSREGIEADLEFEQETGLLVKAGDVVLEDYRPAGNVKRPHRILIGDDPGGNSLQLRMEVTEIVSNATVEDSIFSRPVCTLPMRESVLFKPRRQVEPNGAAMEACAGVYQHPTRAEVTYTVTKQQDHLMITAPGWGQAVEIKPESDWDYFIQFLNLEFHFVRDESGSVTALEFGPERAVRAARVR
jgi:hypothetical protein